MIDLKSLRENPENFKKALSKKYFDIDKLNEVLAIDEKARLAQKKLEDFRAKKNEASGKIAKLKGEEKEKAVAEMQKISEEEKKAKAEFEGLEALLTPLIHAIPNPPLSSVPEGEAEDNKPFKTHGKIKKFNFEPLDHVVLGEKLKWINIEKARESSGSRFYYLQGDAVKIEFALIRYLLEKLTVKGFTPIIPPVLVKEHAMFGTGFFPADKNEIYHVNPEEDNLYLVGTSEVSLAMLHANEILKAEDLPIRYCAFSTCFRREAGSWGKDTHGIIRVHQFDKLEMFSFCHPDKSEEEHEMLLETEEEIMKDLKLPYQVINICGGDLGAPAAKKYDIEAWIPTQNCYRELTSTSNCTDFQARRLQIRFKDPAKKDTMFVHTLNGTACAIGRTLVALMENGQGKDGKITLPKILEKYL